MARRIGLGKGQGKGYKNIVGKDPMVHSQSAKGMKQPQKIFFRVARGSKRHALREDEKKEFSKADIIKEDSFQNPIGLKQYPISELTRDDLKVIKRHSTFTTNDGTEYFAFVGERTLQDIYEGKERLAPKSEGYKEVGKGIFAPREKIIDVPKQVIPAHKKKRIVSWDCVADRWDVDEFDEFEK